MAIDEKLFEEINSKTDILSLASEFVQLSKKGKNFMGLCPFHNEKTPSFSVSPEKNIAVCQGCKQGGAPIRFYSLIKNISLNESAKILGERLGIKVKGFIKTEDKNEHLYKLLEEVMSFYQFALRNTSDGKKTIDYLYSREIDDSTIDHFKLGYAPNNKDSLYQMLKSKNYQVSDMISLGVIKQADDGQYYDLFRNRLIFPVSNKTDRIVGFSARTMNPNDDVKYINSPETILFKKGTLLYHYSDAYQEARREKNVVLYEGFFDVISPYQIGLKNGVATMGTALTIDQAKLIKEMADSVIVAYDGDNAGLSASIKAIPILEKAGLKIEILEIPEKKDPDDFIREYGKEKYESLFGEYTKDPYQFRYDYYKKNKDFNNSNDVKEFKKEVNSFLRNADSSIKQMYAKKALNEYGIEIEVEQSKIIINPKPKITKSRLTSGTENAERELIMMSILNQDYIDLLRSSLDSINGEYVNIMNYKILLQIYERFDNHEEIIPSDFADSFDKEISDYIRNILYETSMWKKQIFNFNEAHVKELIDLVKNAKHERKNKLLKEKRKKVADEYKLENINEYMENKQKLDRRKLN